MEIGKPINLASLDWDDTELIKAYDRGMKLTKKGMSKSKDNKETRNKEKKNEKRWMIGDYCRAPYPDDGLMYEARIINIYDDDDCTVEFVGYDGEEEVLLSKLEESAGKIARRKQKKRADGGGYVSSDTEKSSVSNVRTLREEVEYLQNKLNQIPPPPPLPPFQDFYDTPRPHPSYYQQPPAHPYHNPATALQRVEEVLPPPPAPPMPQCPTIARDPALSAMLVSWYMAGYYTGLHQNQRSSHCSMAPKHCGDYHDNPNCCHH